MKRFSMILFLVLMTSTFGKALEVIETFDIRSYDPVQSGLKDLSFEMEVSNLADLVEKKLPTSKIKKVYFMVYWVFPGRFEIEVEGLPRGFYDIKRELKNLVKNRLDYVIPQKMAPKFRSYKLKSEKTKRGILIKGEDPTSTRAVNRLEIEFHKEGWISKFRTYSPLGFQGLAFKWKTESWSKNKWVLSSNIATTLAGVQKTIIKSKLKYRNIDGFGFPVTVNINTEQVIQVPGKNQKPAQRKHEQVITFKNYLVNKGKAAKYFKNHTFSKKAK
jgi:hypothetical protein